MVLSSRTDFKSDIWNSVTRLNWGDIDTNNFSSPELLCNLDRPDSGSGSEVEDAFRILYLSKMKLSVEHEGIQVVLIKSSGHRKSCLNK